MTRIVYQRSVVNPSVCIPIFHLNDDVGEHIVILMNPERAVSIQSILRDDGGVDHPLLEANVYHDLKSMVHFLVPASTEDNNHFQETIVTPPRIQRANLEGQFSDVRENLGTECWKTKFSLTVLTLLKLFHKSIGTALGQVEFEPVGMSFPALLENILTSNHSNAYEFLHAMKQKNTDDCSQMLTMQLQVLLFLCGLNIGPGRESILSSEYPSVLTSSQVSGEVKRIFLHPQSTIFQMEKNLFSSSNPRKDWERLLVLAADIDDGPYFDMEFSNFPENQKRLYHIACSYMCSMRRCVRQMVEDHGVIPFNIGFAPNIWLRVIHNIKGGRDHTFGLEGDMLKMVNSIFAFYDQEHDPYSHSKSASIMFTSKGTTLAWLVHPVEESYSLAS